jgi:hypothetical protein
MIREINDASLIKALSHAGFALISASLGCWHWYFVSTSLRMPSGLAAWNFPLLATLPGPRFFLPAFFALVIPVACGAEQLDNGPARVVFLSLLCAAGVMFLVVDRFPAAGTLITR